MPRRSTSTFTTNFISLPRVSRDDKGGGGEGGDRTSRPSFRIVVLGYIYNIYIYNRYIYIHPAFPVFRRPGVPLRHNVCSDHIERYPKLWGGRLERRSFGGPSARQPRHASTHPRTLLKGEGVLLSLCHNLYPPLSIPSQRTIEIQMNANPFPVLPLPVQLNNRKPV